MSLISPNLQAFAAIAQTGTVHGAAVVLGLTQTGVTQRLRSLERQVGGTLFLRSRRGMKLTEEGAALLRYCQGARALEGEVLGQIAGAGRQEEITVTVAGPSSVMNSRIVRACLPLYRQWPKLLLNFVVIDSPGRLALVRSGQATLAVVSPDDVPNEMTGKRLKPDQYVLVAPKSWKGRRLADIVAHERIIDFAGDDGTTLSYLKRFGLSGAPRPSRLFANSNEAVIQMFQHGVGYGTLTQEVARPHLQSGRLITLNGGAVHESPHALAWYPRPEMPGYLRAVVDSIR